MVCPWLLRLCISHGPEPVASVLGKTRNVLKMTFHLNLCSKLNWCFSVLFSVLQPLEMNLVELAQHNFSEPPRHPPPFRGKQQQYIFKQTKKKTLAPWAAAVALMRWRRKRNQDQRPKLWHLLILFSCGVQETQQCLPSHLSCLC